MPNLHPDSPASSSEIKKSLWRKPWFIGGIIVVVLIAAGGGAWYFVKHKGSTTGGSAFDKIVIPADDSRSNFNLTAAKQDSLGVDPATTFTLKSKVDVTKQDIEQSLSITPTVKFAVAEKGSKEFTITPVAPLKTGTVYRIALNTTTQVEGSATKQSYSWAFQPKEALTVAGTLPRDKATGVPNDTGIEVTFNTDQVEKFADAFTISPTTKGRFEQHGRTWSFVPEARLADATLYTVIIKHGLGVHDSDVTLTDDLTFRFETAAKSDNSEFSYASFGRDFQAVRPKEAPVLDFSYFGSVGTPKATVYRFPDADTFLKAMQPLDSLPMWATASQSSGTASTTGAQKVGDYDAKVETYNEQTLLRLPAGFEAGYYILNLQVKGHLLQTALVVSDIDAAQFVTRTSTVIWLQDLVSKQPLVGAKAVLTLGSASATSTDQGIVQFQTPASAYDDNSGPSRSYTRITAKDGRETILPFTPSEPTIYGPMSWRGSNAPFAESFWHYVSTDRSLYKPTDTVQLWGVAKQRKDPKPIDLQVDVVSWNTMDWSGDYIPLASTTTTTNASGTFTASLALAQLSPGYYTVRVRDANGKDIMSDQIQVATYTKPAYQITVTPERQAAINNEEVPVKVTTTFFDGTPAPNTRLRWVDQGISEDPGKIITTDSGGSASFTMKAHTGADVQTQGVGVNPVDAAGGSISGSGSFLVFPSSIIFQLDAARTAGKAKVDLTVKNVDLTKPTSGWLDPYDTMTGAVVPNADVTGKVIEQVQHTTKLGTRYDFVEKKVVDTYSYSTTDEVRGTITGKTDAQGHFSTTVDAPGNSYRVEVTVKDSLGRSYTRSAYFANYTDQYQGTNFRVVDLKQGERTDNLLKYPVGATGTVAFQKNGVTVPDKGSFLFVKLQNGLKDFTVTDKSTLPFTFAEADVPNVYYTAVWFDGTAFRSPDQYSSTMIQFDEQTRKLALSVKPDRSSYAPGDTVKLSVHAQDASGKPVKARVNLNAIDEALNVIQDDNAPAPLTLYNPVSDGLLQQYISHKAMALESMAEGGGGGGDARIDFKDAVLFTEVQTGNDGNATATFKVPDNLTSWRVTAQGVTDDLFAGDTVASVPVSKPVFGLLTIPEELVAQDVPVAIGRAYGTALTAGTDVQFTFELPGLADPQTRTGKAYVAQNFTLPKLKVGDQEVRFTVAAGGKKDTLVQTVHVLGSRLTRSDSAFLEAKVGATITGSAQERTLVGVTDLGRGRVINTLQTLQWSYGSRLERQLASRIATDALTSLVGKDDISPNAGFVPTAYQQEDGGLSQVVYGSSDLSLSALAASRSDLFNVPILRQYFLSKLLEKNASKENIGWSLLGLANLSDAVLPDLEQFLQLPDLSAEDQLRAALGYNALGDTQRAYALAVDLLKKYGETQTPYVRLKIGKTEDDYIKNTARFDILAESLKLPERVGIGKFLEVNFPKDDITNLERSLAMIAAVPLLDDQPVTLTYTAGGAAQTVTVKATETKQLSLTSTEAKAFKVSAVQGPVGLTVQTVQPVDPATAPHDSRLNVSRSYAPTSDHTSFQQGDIVRVSINLAAKSGIIDSSFTVIDQLPSGLAIVTDPWNRGMLTDSDTNYPLEIAGQRITFGTWGRKSFHYFARVINPGSYAAEPAVAQGQTSRDVINYSGGQTIEIK